MVRSLGVLIEKGDDWRYLLVGVEELWWEVRAYHGDYLCSCDIGRWTESLTSRGSALLWVRNTRGDAVWRRRWRIEWW